MVKKKETATEEAFDNSRPSPSPNFFALKKTAHREKIRSLVELKLLSSRASTGRCTGCRGEGWGNPGHSSGPRPASFYVVRVCKARHLIQRWRTWTWTALCQMEKWAGNREWQYMRLMLSQARHYGDTGERHLNQTGRGVRGGVFEVWRGGRGGEGRYRQSSDVHFLRLHSFTKHELSICRVPVLKI